MRVSVEGAMCKLLIAIVGTSAASSLVCFVWLVSRRVRADGRTNDERTKRVEGIASRTAAGSGALAPVGRAV